METPMQRVPFPVARATLNGPHESGCTSHNIALSSSRGGGQPVIKIAARIMEIGGDIKDINHARVNGAPLERTRSRSKLGLG